jgi:hypothetical protein
MGSSIAMIDRHYGHLGHDSRDHAVLAPRRARADRGRRVDVRERLGRQSGTRFPALARIGRARPWMLGGRQPRPCRLHRRRKELISRSFPKALSRIRAADLLLTIQRGVFCLEVTHPRFDGDFDPILFLPSLAQAIGEVDARITEIVRHCRATGRTWTQIGEALSISKQAAGQRFSVRA